MAGNVCLFFLIRSSLGRSTRRLFTSVWSIRHTSALFFADRSRIKRILRKSVGASRKQFLTGPSSCIEFQNYMQSVWSCLLMHFSRELVSRVSVLPSDLFSTDYPFDASPSVPIPSLDTEYNRIERYNTFTRQSSCTGLFTDARRNVLVLHLFLFFFISLL